MGFGHTFYVTKLLCVYFIRNIFKHQLVMKLSLTLAKQSVKETGRNLSSLGGWVLEMGTTTALSHCFGTTPTENEQLSKSVRGVLNSYSILNSLTSFGETPSGPHAFDGLIF